MPTPRLCRPRIPSGCRDTHPLSGYRFVTVRPLMMANRRHKDRADVRILSIGGAL